VASAFRRKNHLRYDARHDTCAAHCLWLALKAQSKTDEAAAKLVEAR